MLCELITAINIKFMVTLILLCVINATKIYETFQRDIEFDNQCRVTNSSEVICSVNGNIDLKSEFERIALANPTQIYYEKLFIEDNPIFNEIPDEVFMGLSFGEILVDSSPNLTRIHKNAFISTSNSTHRLWLSTTTKLRDSDPEFDLYHALSTLTSAIFIHIALDPTEAHLIPVNAFRNVIGVQSDLWQILFEGNFRISRIGSNAFYELPSLDFLIFQSTPITLISSQAFDFRTASDVPLEIRLIDCKLSDQSFEQNVFSGANRPLTVDLSNNLLNYLDEYIFSAFLSIRNQNRLNLIGNLLNCSDISRFQWLLLQKEQLESRVLGAKCSNGTNFWDLAPQTTTTTASPTESVYSKFETSFTAFCSGLSLTCFAISCIFSKFVENKIQSNVEFKDVCEKFTFNYGLCMVLINLYNLIGLQATKLTWYCEMWSVLSFYSFMSAFLWILLKSYYMYKITSRLFPNYYRIDYVHHSIVYGVSLFLCIITITIKWLEDKNKSEIEGIRISVNDLFYKTGDSVCWLASKDSFEQFWIILSPALVLLFVSLCFIIYSLQCIHKYAKHNHLNRDHSWVYAFLINYILLTITWFMFNLYANHNQTAFIYIYSVLMCFQAIFMLAFQSIGIYKTSIAKPTTPSVLNESSVISITG